MSEYNMVSTVAGSMIAAQLLNIFVKYYGGNHEKETKKRFG